MADLQGKYRKCRNLGPLDFEKNLLFINHRGQEIILRESLYNKYLLSPSLAAHIKLRVRPENVSCSVSL